MTAILERSNDIRSVHTLDFNDPAILTYGGSTVLQYKIPRKTHVTLHVYSINGQKIKTLVDSVVSPGSNRATWNGTDDCGNEIGSGLYYCSLQAEKSRLVRNLVLMK